jgi:hypothetical protein
MPRSLASDVAIVITMTDNCGRIDMPVPLTEDPTKAISLICSNEHVQGEQE